MTKKDLNFLVEVRIPKSEGDDTVFFVTLGQLHDAIVTHPSGNITFRIGDELLQMERSNVIEIYNLAKQQLITAKSTVPVQLKDYLIDLSASKKSTQTEKISSRDEEIEKLWSCMLLKQKSNAIIVGEHGVGKTTMFHEVVRQLKTGEAPSQIASCKIIQLNTSKLLKIKSDYSIKHVISAIVKYLNKNKNNIILYVDDLLTMKYDIYLAQLLIIILKKLNVKFVASITYENYENYFEADDTICKYLNPIYLTEPDIEDIYEIVLSKVLKLQKKYGIKISEEMINFAIFTGCHLSSSNSAEPESTIDVINFAFADAKRINSKEVSKKNILRYYFINFKLDKKAENNRKTGNIPRHHRTIAEIDKQYAQDYLRSGNLSQGSVEQEINYRRIQASKSLIKVSNEKKKEDIPLVRNQQISLTRVLARQEGKTPSEPFYDEEKKCWRCRMDTQEEQKERPIMTSPTYDITPETISRDTKDVELQEINDMVQIIKQMQIHKTKDNQQFLR